MEPSNNKPITSSMTTTEATNDHDREEQQHQEEVTHSAASEEPASATMTTESDQEEEEVVNEIRMDKDPLGVGIPLPVIVRRTIKRTNTGTSVFSDEGTASVSGGAREEATRPGAVEVGVSRSVANLLEKGVLAAPPSTAPSSSTTAATAPSTAPEPPTLSRGPDLVREVSMPGIFAVPGLSLDGQAESCGPDRDIETGGSHTGNTAGSEAFSIIPDPLELRAQDSTLVSATLVLNDDDEERRNRHNDNLVIHAEAKPLGWSQRASASFLLGAMLIVAAVVIAIVLAVVLTRDQGGADTTTLILDPSTSSGGLSTNETDAVQLVTEPRLPKLDVVRARGFLRCGAVMQMKRFFAEVNKINEANNYTSIVDILGVPSLKSMFVPNVCSALAAAVFGNSSAYEIVTLPEDEKYHLLKNGSIDLLFTRQSITMEQDIYQEGLDEGISYSIPYLFGGIGFTGDPAYVNCADDNIKTLGNCSALTICINQESIFLRQLEVRIPQRQVVVEDSWMALIDAFTSGKCNVIATESAVLISASIQAMGYDQPLSVGKREYTSEMWATKTLDSDPEWHNFLDAIFMALLAAEEAGVTKEDAHRMGKTSIFGKEFEDMFINAVAAGGNYAQIYSFPMPRDGRNMINDGTTGLLASPPLGPVDIPFNAVHDPTPTGTLEAVLSRGVLRCGIRGGRPGFATYNSDLLMWEGMDVEFCRALDAALFNHGDANKVIFEDISDVDGYEMLREGTLDVISGAIWTLQDDMNGSSFSRPYFFGPVEDRSFDENLCLATHQNDAQWSSFIYWAAQSLVLAEEKGIVQDYSFEMPLVYSFGPDLVRMFRDIVHYSGNYAQFYERNVAHILPRGGRNTLNLFEDNISPLGYIPPGFDISDS